MAEPSTADQLVGERIAGRFVIERLIGSGPMSSAFRARDERLHRRVTVKLFHPQHADDVEVVATQLELATAVARLSHPNIATVIDRGEHEGMPFIVLEHVRGENLQERIDRYAPLGAAEVVELGTSIAKALVYAHAHQVSHGNLRPENLLISEDREVKLVDFGGGSWLAALAGNGSTYVPPERMNSPEETPATPADDIYALGVVLYVALTEREPEAAIDASRVQLLRPDVSPRLASVVARALAPDPAQRYTSMNEFISELSSVRVQSFDRQATRATTEQATGLLSAVDGSDAATGEIIPPSTARSTRRATSRRSSWMRRLLADRALLVVLGMLLLPVSAVVLVGLMLAGELSNSGTANSKKPTVVHAKPRPVTITRAGTLDPYGTGEVGENDESINEIFEGGAALTGDNSSYWVTEGYDAADMTKDGLGFWVELAQRSVVKNIRIASDPQGWQAQVFAADQPLSDFTGWKSVSKSVAVVNKRMIPIDTDGRPYRVYMVKITRLSIDTDPESDGRFRARISDVQVMT